MTQRARRYAEVTRMHRYCYRIELRYRDDWIVFQQGSDTFAIGGRRHAERKALRAVRRANRQLDWHEAFTVGAP